MCYKQKLINFFLPSLQAFLGSIFKHEFNPLLFQQNHRKQRGTWVGKHISNEYPIFHA